MHIEFLADTPTNKKGDKRHLAADVCRTLVALGFAKEVPPAPPEPAVTSWAVKIDTHGAPFILGACSRACGTYRYLGPPEHAHRSKFQHSCGATPVEVPQSIVDQYKAAYGSATPTGTFDDQKLIDARQIGGRIDAAYDAQFQKLYGRPRRW